MIHLFAATIALETAAASPAAEPSTTSSVASAPSRAVVSLSMHFDAPPELTSAAFGPIAESVWSPEFQPHFIESAPAAQVAGAVFTTPDGKLWLLHDYDTAGGLVQYVIVDARSLLVTLTIRISADPSGSAVTMTYDGVALDDGGRAHLEALKRHSQRLRDGMQTAVAAYLKTGGQDTR